MGVQIAGLIGLYEGAVFGILGWWFGRRMAKQNNVGWMNAASQFGKRRDPFLGISHLLQSIFYFL